MHTEMYTTKCTTQCFIEARTAAAFIQQSLRTGWKPELPIYSVNCTSTYALASLYNVTCYEIKLIFTKWYDIQREFKIKKIYI